MFCGITRYNWKALFLLSAIGLCFPLGAQSDAGPGLDSHSIPMLYDQERMLTIENIRSMEKTAFSQTADALSGYHRGNYWLRIEPELLHPAGGYLFEEYGVDEIELFIPQSDGGYESRVSGWAYPAASRALPLRHTNFAVSAASISRDRPFYVRLASDTSMQTALSFRNSVQLDAFHRSDTWLLGIFYGVCLGVLFYNIFFSVILHNRAQLIFLGYLITSILVFAYNNGLGSVLLWPRTPEMNYQSLILITPLGLIFLVLFSRELIREEINSQLFDRSLLGFAATLVLLMLILQFLDHRSSYQSTSYFFLLVPVLMMSISIFMLLRNHSLKWFFLTSLLLYMAGIVLIMLRNIGVLGQTALINFSFQIGYLAYLLILGLSLSQRINTLREAAEYSQVQLATLNSDLESTVNERTQELKTSNTDLQRKIIELRLTQKNLSEAEKHAALGRLVAGLAHEINTPLGNSVTATSYMQSVIGKWESAASLEDINMIELKEIGDMISRNLKITSQLVDGFKELATDQYAEEPRSFAIADYIDDLALSFAHRFKQLDLQFENHVDRSIKLYAVPGHFARIFTNLINNSLDHGFPDSPDNALNKHSADSPKIILSSLVSSTGLQLIYSDNGEGAPTTMMPRLFDPFSTSKRSLGFKGLGLSIVYNLVSNSLSGSIEAGKTDNGKLRFIITLPSSQKEKPR